MLSFLSCCLKMRRRASKWREIEGSSARETQMTSCLTRYHVFALETPDPIEKLSSCVAPENVLMMQGFEWHVPADQRHWKRLRKALPSLKDIGVDNIWIPPGCKGMDPSGTGYDLYDMYDLGEFYQKGCRATRWGSKESLQRFGRVAQKLSIGIYWDTVLNHKAGADYTESFAAVKVNPKGIFFTYRFFHHTNRIPGRNTEISRPEEIAGWVGFNFPGRGNKYSSMKYHALHFTGVDWNDTHKEHAIYKTVGPNKGWASDVSDENGNYDYLMFADLDHSHPEVRADIFNWVKWLAAEVPISGMRIDACKHYSAAFQKEFVDHLRNTVGADYFLVGEYWRGEVNLLLDYLKLMEHRVSLFDVPLVGRFSVISQMEKGDLRRIFQGTLVERCADHAVVSLA